MKEDSMMARTKKEAKWIIMDEGKNPPTIMMTINSDNNAGIINQTRKEERLTKEQMEYQNRRIAATAPQFRQTPVRNMFLKQTILCPLAMATP